MLPNKGLPKDTVACAKKAQPGFNGKQSYYNSGFIPYLGENGNEYELEIADDAKPGTYLYYCVLHGLGMSGQITVTGNEDKVESQAELQSYDTAGGGNTSSPTSDSAAPSLW